MSKPHENHGTEEIKKREMEELQKPHEWSEAAKPLPCPFCGGGIQIWIEKASVMDAQWLFVQCIDCGARRDSSFLSKDEAIKYWSERHVEVHEEDDWGPKP